jgi:uncharacterized protein (DUF885 family)
MGPRQRDRLVVLALIAVAACVAPAGEDPSAESGRPLTRDGYARRLATAAGGPVSVDRMVELAAESATRIEEHMDWVAEGLGEPGGWRPLFASLRLQTPADEAAVLEAYRAELTRAAGYVEDHYVVTSPPPLPEVMVLENPSLRAHFPFALYHDGRFAVTTAAAAGDDPSYLTNHCRVCIPPLAVHEGYPGHHVAFARMRNAAGEAPTVAELAHHKPFVEGWALYAELLMLESSYYVDLEVDLAAWRMVLLRLVRAEIDARLHGGELEPAAAERIYRERLLLTPAAAAAELRAHLAKPTVKASYFVGLLQILELRQAFRAANPGLLPRDFHDRLLGPPAAIPRIARERFEVELGPPGEVDLPWPWSPRTVSLEGSSQQTGSSEGVP